MIVNPPDLYGGAAFKVDLTPLVNLTLRREKEEKAWADATNKYYDNLMNKATDTGMRDQDKPLFEKAIQNFKNYYIQNSDKIIKGDMAARAKADELARVPLQVANSSRSAFNNDLKLANVNKDRWTESTKKQLTKSTSPTHIVDVTGAVVPNPEYSYFNFATIENDPEAVDLQSYYAGIGKTLNVVKSERLLEEKPTSSKFKKIQVVKEEISADDAKRIGDYAAGDWDSEANNDKYEFNFRKYLKAKGGTFADFKNQYAQEFADLNEAFKYAYGKDIGSDKDLFSAYAIKTNMGGATKEKQITDDKALIDYRAEKAKELTRLSASLRKTAPAQTISNLTTAFEDIQDGTFGGYTKRGDYWYDQSGNLATTAGFDVRLPVNMVPAGIKEYARGKTKDAIESINIKIKNGVAVAAIDEDGFLPLVAREQVLVDENKSKTAQKRRPMQQTQGAKAQPSGGKIDKLGIKI